MKVPSIRFKEFTTVWKAAKVEDYYKLIPTNSFSRNDLNYTSGSVKNIHYGDIHVKFNSHLDIENEVLPFINDTVNFKRYSTDSMCAEGDIILADASEDVKDIGKSVEITSVNNEKILSGLHTIHLRPISDSFAVGFSGYLFRTSDVVKQIRKESQGAKVLGISGKKILKTEFLFPSKSEQQEIAGFLKKVDRRIRYFKEKKELLEKYKAGVMKKLFSQELRFKDDNGLVFQDWEYKTIGEICEVIGGGTPDTGNIEYWNGNIQWFTPSEIKSNFVSSSKRTISLLGLKKSSARLLPKGTVLLTTRATIGEVAITQNECSTNQGFQSLISKDNTSNLFIFNWIKCHKHLLKSKANGSTFSEISKSEIEKISISTPCYQEQVKIGKFLNNLDLKIMTIENEVASTELWKKGLLQQMFV